MGEAKKEYRGTYKGTDYLTLEALPRMPDFFDDARGGPLPPGIEGATIVRFGAAPNSADVEGGGLIIDYIPQGSETTVRAVFGHTELSMWLEYCSIPLPNPDEHQG